MWGWIIFASIIVIFIVLGKLVKSSSPLVCAQGKTTVGGNLSLCYNTPKPGYSCFETVCTKECPPGMRNDGLYCLKTANKDRGIGKIAELCGQGQEGPPCYTKCKDGYKGVGPVCWENCPSGTVDTGAFCLNNADTIIIDRYKRTDIGRIPDLSPCPSGTVDGAGSCWEPVKTVDNGYYNYSAGCGTSIVPCYDGSTGCKSNCYRTWISRLVSTGCGCIKVGLADRKQSCRSDEEMINGLCYPKCRTGFSSSLGDILFCKSDAGCPSGYNNTGLTCYKGPVTTAKKSYTRPLLPAICPPGKVLEDALCYTPCPPGYKGVGSVCWPDCPPEFKDIGISCGKPSYDRGAGTIADSCPPGKFKLLNGCI